MKSFYLSPGIRCTECGHRFADNALDQHKQLRAAAEGNVTLQCRPVAALPAAGLMLTKRGVWVIDPRLPDEKFQTGIVL